MSINTNYAFPVGIKRTWQQLYPVFFVFSDLIKLTMSAFTLTRDKESIVALCVSINSFTSLVYPFCAAKCNGVMPDLDLALT